MESITRNRQAPETLRAMITRAHGPDQAPDVHFGGPLTETERTRRRYGMHLLPIMVIETDYRGHTDTKQYRTQPVDLMARFGHHSQD